MPETVLPVHPFTGLTAVGIVNGRPVWPILGGAEGDPDGGDGGAGDGGSDGGDGGEKQPTAEERIAALENQVAAAKKVNRDLERKNKTALAEIDTLKTKVPEGDAPDPDAIKAEARKEALAEAKAASDARILRAEIKAAAGTKLADPNDAVRLLDLDDFEVDEHGNVDQAEIAKAIDALVKSKPYLAAEGKRFQGGGDGGAREGSQTPTQLTQSELKRMYDDKQYAEIDKARQEGRLADLFGAKTT